MDTLVALGATAAFGYSTYALFAMTDAVMRGADKQVMAYMHDFYFESAAMILTLITVGKMLEARSKGKTTDALKGLLRLAPKTAVVVRDGAEVTVDIAVYKKTISLWSDPEKRYRWMASCWMAIVRWMNRHLQERVFRWTSKRMTRYLQQQSISLVF